MKDEPEPKVKEECDAKEREMCEERDWEREEEAGEGAPLPIAPPK